MILGPCPIKSALSSTVLTRMCPCLSIRRLYSCTKSKTALLLGAVWMKITVAQCNMRAAVFRTSLSPSPLPSWCGRFIPTHAVRIVPFRLRSCVCRFIDSNSKHRTAFTARSLQSLGTSGHAAARRSKLGCPCSSVANHGCNTEQLTALLGTRFSKHCT